MQRANYARMMASTRSVFARQPLARAKSRAWRGLTTAHRQTVARQFRGYTHFQTARGLHHDQCRRGLSQTFHDLGKASIVVIHMQQLLVRVDMHIQCRLHLFSLPFLAKCGFGAQATVRVQGEKPAGRNSLHWALDVTFREDGCRVRKGHAPQNFSAFSQIRAGAFAPG
jgi:hypothetical protein